MVVVELITVPPRFAKLAQRLPQKPPQQPAPPDAPVVDVAATSAKPIMARYKTGETSRGIELGWHVRGKGESAAAVANGC